MATALRRLRLKRVSLVDQPANEAARVVLYKSADDSMTEFGRGEMELLEKAPLGGEARGNLSDADFAAVWTDSEGRKFRKLPIHDAAHVRNALARWNQVDLPPDIKAKARRKLEAKAKELGIGDYAEKMQPTAAEVHVDGFANCKKCGTAVKKGEKVCPKCGQPMMAEMEPDEDDVAKAADGRPKEDEMDEKLKADLDAALAKVEALTAERDALQKRLDTPEEIEKRKLESLPEAVRKQLQDQAEEIRKMRDEREEAEHVAKAAKEMPNVPGKSEDLGKLLKRFKDVAKAEDFEALTTVLKAASAQIEKGKLFAEIGKPGDGGDETPLAQFERKAQEIVAKGAGKVAIDEAYAIVARQEPALYREYSRAVTRGATPSNQTE